MQEFKSIHHSFDVDIASQYGIAAAILIHHFQHWISTNIRMGINKQENRTWTYQTIEEIAAHYPYWSKSEVFESLERLCNGKGRRSKRPDLEFEPILMKGNFNKKLYDRTTWYAFVDEQKWLSAKIDVGLSQNGDWLEPTPIPHTKTHTKEEKKETYKERTPSPPKGESLSFGRFVRLSKEEHEKLQSDHGVAVVTEIIASMNDYLSSQGKKPYRDYAAAIRNWIRRRNPAAFSTKAPSAISVNRTGAMEVKSMFRKENDPLGKEFYLNETELVRLDTGERISLSLEPNEFETMMIKIFKLKRSDE